MRNKSFVKFLPKKAEILAAVEEEGVALGSLNPMMKLISMFEPTDPEDSAIFRYELDKLMRGVSDLTETVVVERIELALRAKGIDVDIRMRGEDE